MAELALTDRRAPARRPRARRRSRARAPTWRGVVPPTPRPSGWSWRLQVGGLLTCAAIVGLVVLPRTTVVDLARRGCPVEVPIGTRGRVASCRGTPGGASPTSRLVAAVGHPAAPLPRRPASGRGRRCPRPTRRSAAQSRPEPPGPFGPSPRRAFDTRPAVSDPRPSAAPMAAVRARARTKPLPILEPRVSAGGDRAGRSARESLSRTPYATWRSLDAEIGGPVRGCGHSGRGLRRHQRHPSPGQRGRPVAPQRRARRPRRPKRRRRPAAAGEINLFGTRLRAEEATAQGGTVIIGDWQEATQFNPYYFGQVTEGNVASLVWHTLLTITTTSSTSRSSRPSRSRPPRTVA